MDRRLLVIAGATALILGTGIATVVLWQNNESGPRLSASAFMTPDFTLVDEEGTTVTEANFAGRPSAWFFGFTHCPDVCPTALAQMSVHLQNLGADAEGLDMVFVTVDPERDTQPIMATYLTAFDERISGLTGTLTEIEKVARGFFVYFAKVPLEGGGYTMDHTAGILLRAADGEFMGTLDPHEAQAVQLEKLRLLLEG